MKTLQAKLFAFVVLVHRISELHYENDMEAECGKGL